MGFFFSGAQVIVEKGYTINIVCMFYSVVKNQNGNFITINVDFVNDETGVCAESYGRVKIPLKRNRESVTRV